MKAPDNPLTAARTLLEATNATQADLEHSISDIEALSAEAGRRVAFLTEARQAIIISGSFEDLAKHGRATESERFVQDQALAIAEELRRKLGPVAEANRIAAIGLERDQVETMMTLAGEELRKLPKLTATIRKIIGVVAAADVAAMNFAEAHPDEPPIATAESRVRHEPERRKVVREERVWAWLFPSGKLDTMDTDWTAVQPDPNDPANASLKSLWTGARRQNCLELIESGQISPSAGHVFRASSGEGPEAKPVLAVRRHVEVTPAHHPESIASSLRIPALRRGDHGWSLEDGDAPIDVLNEIDRPPAHLGLRSSTEVELVPV